MSFAFPPALANAFDEQTRQLRAELAASPRLRIGLAAIAAILALYGLLQWNESLDARREELAKLNHAIERLRESRGAGPMWRQRAAASAKALQAFDQRIWHAPSFGRAQASFQDWIGGKLATLQIQRPQINQLGDAAAGAKFGQGEPVPMKLSVTADVFSAIQLENLLAGIYMADRNLRIDTLNASKTRRRIEIVLVAWTAPGPDSAPAPDPAQSAVTAPQPFPQQGFLPPGLPR